MSMSSVAVLIPWAGDCPHRKAALGYVRKWYQSNYPDWEIHEGYAQEGAAWCKGQAVADALRWTRADVLVIADADSVAPNVGDAVKAVQRDRAWAMAHHMVHRLSWAATMKVFNSSTWPQVIPRDKKHYDAWPYIAMAGGGITVINRDIYLQAPMDHRFLGWGQEDGAWGTALTRLYGPPWRSPHARLWHLWHPPQRKVAKVHGPLGVKDLQLQYRSAQTTQSMQAVLDEPRRYVRQVLAEAPRVGPSRRA
jgi:hypothetical protein